MSYTVSQAFSEFLSSITSTPHQKDVLIPARKNGAVEILQKAFPSSADMPFSHAVLMGSASKNTIVRPFDDVDVLAVFSNENGAWGKYAYDSRKFLYKIREAYNGVSSQQVGARGQAVRVFFKGGGHVDVAPVFLHSGTRYQLPAGDGTWIFTQPTVANDWFSSKNREMGYNLAPLVRLVKVWNQAHSKHFRSFHLETMTANAFSSINGNRQEALAKFFVWAQHRIDAYDPGGESGNLASYMSTSSRSDAVRALARAASSAETALQAEAAGDHDGAKKIWRVILGNDFPIR